MTLNGASNTLEVLNFFYEASQFTQPDGNPILECGDVIVVDVALHHFDGGQALAEWLDSSGVTLVYSPVYSPELTRIELIFNQMKTFFHICMNTVILRFKMDVAIFTVCFKRYLLVIYVTFMI